MTHTPLVCNIFEVINVFVELALLLYDDAAATRPQRRDEEYFKQICMCVCVCE